MSTEVTNINQITIPIIKGDRVPFNFVITAEGTAINLTGGTLIMTIKNHWSDEESIIEKTNEQHDDAVNGLSSIVLESADTDLLTVGNDYYFSVKFIDSAGQPMTYARGKFDIIWG